MGCGMTAASAWPAKWQLRVIEERDVLISIDHALSNLDVPRVSSPVEFKHAR